ncbi:S1C family serine protease [Gloeobacter violaceus]|nr:trypsin-like peptidase domain-containing protein [Gloeobacter violaceus]
MKIQSALAALAVAALPLNFPAALLAFDPEETTTIDVYDRTSRAVVSIRTSGGIGAGAIIDPRGVVITNNHVVRGSTRVQVQTADGRVYPGAVRALDRRNDLAIVDIRPERPLPSIDLARSSARVGQRVYAIGNPFGLDRTLTVGILSRIAPNGDLQTDAALNPGNSGGPLLNSDGEIIGINKAILSRTGGNVGIGFATPTGAVRSLVAASPNPDSGRVAVRPGPQRGLGVVLDARSLTVLEVQPGSAAERAGLLPGDQLLGVGDAGLENSAQLQQILQRNPGTLVLTVVRDRQVGRIRVEL